VALDPCTLMAWTPAEIEDQVTKQPRLGVALLQMLVKRSMDYEERLQSFALDKTPDRTEDGSVKIPPLTHQVISEYVGTSREIVTFQMNHLRQRGYLRYSRKAIQVYAEALREHLRERTGEAVAWNAAEGRGLTSGNSPQRRCPGGAGRLECR
jgi:CRP-like cAMP-binding protein